MFEPVDFYKIDNLLTEEHKLIRNSIRDFVNLEISPNIETWYEENHFPIEIVKKMGSIGAFGPTVAEKYGGGGLDYISYGLIMQEIERGDSGMRSTASVQTSLVMFPIEEYGSEEQKKKFLPKLASGEILGCFGLTEPDHGSNPGGMITKIEDKGEYYLLNGSKMWISNSPKADIAIVWAKDENKRIKGLIVEREMEGFSTPKTEGKWSLRSSLTGELVFDNVKIPKENLLPNMHKVSSKTDIHFKEKVTYPGLLIDSNSEPVRYVKKLLNNEKHKKVIFGSEGGLFQEKLNLPTVVCGPGSIDQAHKANEYISIDQLEKGSKFLDDLINSCR